MLEFIYQYHFNLSLIEKVTNYLLIFSFISQYHSDIVYYIDSLFLNEINYIKVVSNRLPHARSRKRRH